MGGARHVDVPGIHHRFAHAQRIEQRQFITVFQHQLRQAQQHHLALARGHFGPRTVFECTTGTADGQVDFGLATGNHPGQHAVVGRVDYFNTRIVLCLAGLTLNQRGVDQSLLLCQGCPVV
ncbi:hypothetical protein D3C78_664800 [compost metagenome]